MNGGDCRPLLSSYVEASGLRASQWVFDQRGGSGVRSSCHSNERRRGSDGFNATAVAVDKNARCDFQLQCAVGGDDSYLKRSGSSMPPILSTHSLLSTTDFLSCLSCSPLTRRLTGQLRPGQEIFYGAVRFGLNPPCEPTQTVSACYAQCTGVSAFNIVAFLLAWPWNILEQV